MGHARVYHGRHKGETSIHVPNNKVREGYDRMKLGSHFAVCEKCEEYGYGTRNECRMWKCPVCGEYGKVIEKEENTITEEGND